MNRRLLLGWMAMAPFLSAASGLKPKPLLTVSGQIGKINNPVTNSYDFSEAEFLKLPTVSITTGTPWTPTSVFTGPLVVDVMRAAGVTAGLLTFQSLDGNSVQIPWDDLLHFGVILAHSQDGVRLDNRRWGPLWTIYPRDQNAAALRGPVAESRFIWQVDRIEVGR